MRRGELGLPSFAAARGVSEPSTGATTVMSDRRSATGITLHLCPEPHWAAHTGQRHYTPEPFAEEGFIHTTHGDEMVVEIANLFYTADPRPFVVATVDLAKVESETIYEDPDFRFPHIYGPLNLDAVTGLRRVLRDDSGRFLGIGEAL
jgi:uncharacterized protein (DUF952 family)